jgi:tetratricopeptide (TPR) repeat protein
MTAEKREQQRREAFQLYQQGKFADSLAICQAGGADSPDSQMSILVARNLYNLGRYEEAEACARDLILQMPDTSQLHSFLGKILEKRDEDAAVAEYTRAVVLDPGNQEALRSYAAFLVSRDEHRMAIPVLRRIAVSTGKEDEYRQLARALTASGSAREALSLFGKDIRKRDGDHDYLDALMGAGLFPDASREASIAYRRTGDVAFARVRLQALALKEPAPAIPEYSESWREQKDPGIAYDYAVLLFDLGHTAQALGICREAIDTGIAIPDRHFRLLICKLNATAGEKDRALGCFEHLAKESLQNLEDPGFLSGLLASYREFLRTYYPVSTALPRFLSLVEGNPNLTCLIETGRLYESIGDTAEAKASYYRAFRSDFLSGGMEYARFLARTGDLRECEKILLHVLANIRKVRDLVEVAGLILHDQWKLYRQKRLLEHLILSLEARIPVLGSTGLECLSVAYLVIASGALKERNYQQCKEFCLRGLDIVPADSRHIGPADFLDLLTSCKNEAVCDIPVMERRGEITVPKESREILDQFLAGCDPQEKTIIEFLFEHREASEMDLRRLLNTRRVAGVVNRIIQKAAEKGLVIIEKRGTGEGGEIYAYIGG